MQRIEKTDYRGTLEREYLATLVSKVMQNPSTETAHAYHKTKMGNT